MYGGGEEIPRPPESDMTAAPAVFPKKTQRTFFLHARWLSLARQEFVIAQRTDKGRVKETSYRLAEMDLPGLQRGWMVGRLDKPEVYWIGVDRGIASCDCAAHTFTHDNRPCKHLLATAMILGGQGFPQYVVDAAEAALQAAAGPQGA